MGCGSLLDPGASVICFAAVITAWAGAGAKCDSDLLCCGDHCLPMGGASVKFLDYNRYAVAVRVIRTTRCCCVWRLQLRMRLYEPLEV